MRNNKRCLIITTSLDYAREKNVGKNIYQENSIIKLPNANIKGFVDTATGEFYEPGSKIKVQNSMHFNVILD